LYLIPSSSIFIWNGEVVEFNKADAYGITKLSNSISLTNLITNNKQFMLSWKGNLLQGDRTEEKLLIAEPNKEMQAFDLSFFRVIQSGESGNYLVFGNEKNTGELFFTE
jgi:hypothetical protein